MTALSHDQAALDQLRSSDAYKNLSKNPATFPGTHIGRAEQELLAAIADLQPPPLPPPLPPPPPPPPPVGEVLFYSDFKTLPGPWQAIEDVTTVPNDAAYDHGRITKDTKDGIACARFDLPASNKYNRAELVSPDSLIVLGKQEFFGFEMWIPADLRTGGWGLTAAQIINHPLVYGSVLPVILHDDWIDLAIQAGYSIGPPNPSPHCEVDLHIPLVPKGRMKRDVFTQGIIGWVPAVDNTGKVRAWERRRGETVWNKTVDYSGKSLQWSSSNAPNPHMTLRFFAEAYRSEAPNWPLSLYHANWVRGTTFEAVARMLG